MATRSSIAPSKTLGIAASLLWSLSAPSAAQDVGATAGSIADGLKVVKFVADISKQCSSLKRFNQRSSELRKWAADPAEGVKNAGKKDVGVLWIAGRSDWNCACYRILVESAGVSWQDFLDINGDKSDWKASCRK